VMPCTAELNVAVVGNHSKTANGISKWVNLSEKTGRRRHAGVNLCFTTCGIEKGK
jgi:hypothetical protein